MFGRSSKTETPTPEAFDSAEIGGKGRATPRRREAEAARKQRLKPPRTRREMAQRARQARTEDRQRMMAAMRSGEDRFLPRRDQGPVRRFARDFVDARLNLGELLLPLLLVSVVVGLAGAYGLQSSIFLVALLGGVTDSVYLCVRLRRELRRRFPEGETKGATLYALLRSTQIRRFRRPDPQVDRGQVLDGSYR